MKKLVHIIDDDDVIKLIFNRALKTYDNLEVQHFSNGTDALEAFRKERPTITFLDYHLPDMKGGELMTQCLNEDPDQKIIIISDSENAALKDDLLAQGASGFISKKFDDFKEALDLYL